MSYWQSQGDMVLLVLYHSSDSQGISTKETNTDKGQGIMQSFKVQNLASPGFHQNSMVITSREV